VVVLPEGIHPAEIVSALIGIEDKHYGFWLMALILWTLATLFAVSDNIPGWRILDACEHVAFLIGTIVFAFGLFIIYKRYERLAGGAI